MRKIKVLWLCNIIVPEIQKMLGMPEGNSGGWIVNTLDMLSNDDRFEIGYCAPLKSDKKVVDIKYKNIHFWGFNKKNWQPHVYDKSVEEIFKGIIADFQPDIVHIFGTEFPHTLAMTRAFNNPKKTVIHIQGIISECAKEYCAYLPAKVVHHNTFRDFIRHDNIYNQAKKFEQRGLFEIEAVKNVGHIMGRTDWDRSWTYKINPKAKYHYCEENLRKEFMTGDRWNESACEKYSIFMTQGSYPLKGLHLAIEALKNIRSEYPDTKLYLTGDDPRRLKSIGEKMREQTYDKYIRHLIRKYELENNIIFLGSLNAEEMKKQYLKANVLVSASTIENSSNSIMEAKALGVPIVASDVGGVSTIISDGKEGYLYKADDTNMLAQYIKNIFERPESLQISTIEAELDISGGIKRLCSIYQEIYQQN